MKNDKRKATPKNPKKRASAAKPPVDAYGNTWTGVAAATTQDLAAAAAALGVSLPPALRALFLTCGGGTPKKNLFCNPASEAFEVGVGYILPVLEHKKKRGLVSTCEVSRRVTQMPVTMIPFALDSGHANLICLSVPEQDIFYWLHDDPDDRRRRLAPSLAEFLAGLEDRYY